MPTIMATRRNDMVEMPRYLSEAYDFFVGLIPSDALRRTLSTAFTLRMPSGEAHRFTVHPVCPGGHCWHLTYARPDPLGDGRAPVLPELLIRLWPPGSPIKALSADRRVCRPRGVAELLYLKTAGDEWVGGSGNGDSPEPAAHFDPVNLAIFLHEWTSCLLGSGPLPALEPCSTAASVEDMLEGLAAHAHDYLVTLLPEELMDPIESGLGRTDTARLAIRTDAEARTGLTAFYAKTFDLDSWYVTIAREGVQGFEVSWMVRGDIDLIRGGPEDSRESPTVETALAFSFESLGRGLDAKVNADKIDRNELGDHLRLSLLAHPLLEQLREANARCELCQ